MSDNKPFSSGRWKDIPIPIPFPTGDITEFTEEEKKQNDKDFEKILKEYGVLNEEDRIENSKVIKGKHE